MLDRTGESFITKEGYKITVIKFISSRNCTIQFEDGTVIPNIEFGNVKRGFIKNPFHKTIYNIGYIGIGSYKSGRNKKHTDIYTIWLSMLGRCYNPKYQFKQVSYIGCTVYPDWHNFQIFADWVSKYYVEGFELDKDILFKGNKIYSPDTCCFVPKEINNLFVKRNSLRGKCPIGVFHKMNRFIARLNFKGKTINLG